MILTDDEIKERIESPLNLLNRLKSGLNRSTTKHPPIPAIPPKAEDIITDLEDKLNHTSSRRKASNILLAAMTELEARIPEISKPEALARIAEQMSRVISVQDARPANGNNIGQIIVYAPQIQSLDNFEVIDVTE